MDFPSCIRSKPWLMSASFNLCVIRSSMLILRSMYQSTSLGTAFGGAKGRRDVPKIVDWYMDRKINIDDLITHKLKLADINQGFDLMHEGKSIRSVVVY